jgi:peptide/nickel transport system ATP-binding protein
MYQGKLVEIGLAEDVFHRPAHHYTRALVAAIPDPSPKRRSVTAPLDGEVPSVTEQVRGCAFAGRCRAATARCREEAPALTALGNRRAVACHYPL